MKVLLLSFALICSMLCISCSESTTDPDGEAATNTLTATINGNAFVANEVFPSKSATSVNISGTRSSDKFNVAITLHKLEKGSASVADASFGSVLVTQFDERGAIPVPATSGTIEITNVTSNSVSGAFSVVAGTFTVTNGKFTAVY